MDKNNKRESRQTGMTDKRLKGLERARENKGQSRLAQAIEVTLIFLFYPLIILFFSQENLTHIKTLNI